jgi:hypothetical protein
MLSVILNTKDIILSVDQAQIQATNSRSPTEIVLPDRLQIAVLQVRSS